MKKFLSLISIVALLFIFAVPAMAWDFGYNYSNSNYADSSNPVGNVNTNTDSFYGGAVLFYGHANGGAYAGGQAYTDIDLNSTYNFGEAIGSFNFNTGGWAGAVAGTKGDVDQYSYNASLVADFGSAESAATQGSAAGFAGADIGLGNDSGSFTGDSWVTGYTASSSYKDIIRTVKWNDTTLVGTQSVAWNNATTVLDGNYGCGYAGGNGAISGQSAIDYWDGSTSGMYAGQFSYNGNGSGSVAGVSVSSYQSLAHGAVYGTQTSISVNVTN